ncbi:MAG: hypothetical protein A2231_11510 [Candidatus Firestonebacteria bacterium RIFOXYA2_FULL_40_8]|nr:MAG: hypothetical protein A2231_11510 [Candidatus Firestonebacteria bacterium RIFOXYA2_FULL_40_8]
MNRTKIEWCNFTWNPLVGCKYGCSYCYANVLNHRFHWLDDFSEPEYFRERLEDPIRRKKPSKIFTGSVCDQFGGWVDENIINDVLNVVRKCPQHTFQFLTKNPVRLQDFKFPDNSWIGTTIDHCENAGRSGLLKLAEAKVRFISFEPLLSDMTTVPLDGINWIIVGAMTGKQAVSPEMGWVRNIIKSATAKGIPVFLKNSIAWPEKLQQYPM